MKNGTHDPAKVTIRNKLSGYEIDAEIPRTMTVSTLMAQAAIGAAALNVQINAQALSDQEAAQGWLDQLQHIYVESEALLAEVKKILAQRAELYLDAQR